MPDALDLEIFASDRHNLMRTEEVSVQHRLIDAESCERKSPCLDSLVFECQLCCVLHYVR